MQFALHTFQDLGIGRLGCTQIINARMKGEQFITQNRSIKSTFKWGQLTFTSYMYNEIIKSFERRTYGVITANPKKK